jgi:hypothetical protein
MTFRFFILFSFLTQVVFGQQNQLDDPYRFSDQIFKDYQQDTSQFRCDRVAWKYSFIGDYKNTLIIWDTCDNFDFVNGAYQRTGSVKNSLSTDDSAYFSRFKPQNAMDYIAGKAKNERIVIINEAHQQPMHRVFTESLLQTLYDSGFRYIGLETISHFFDTLYNVRKYPIMTTGFYSKEPQYGNLIRRALEIGYIVFPYEKQGPTDRNQREIQQADNINKILIKDPTAKILIHCGFGHVCESYYSKTLEYVMAGRLKNLTGIDPLTINQTELTESGNPDFENPYYKQINLDYDAVFVDSSGQAFYGDRRVKRVDMYVYHPRTKWIYGRPNWVFNNNKIPTPICAQITLTFPCLVFAYKSNEDITTAVPVDVIELASKTDDKYLALYKGRYIIIVKDKLGQTQEIEISN